ncbi:M57 family metalloprotease [Flavilitoribacter nigricans]|uniref:Protease B n=1 Tax=Flavilitoribacter nigricans (strain ATCC 23147 / DSM 23189 / NBRC 102662 / NCIMB 1420 / SS-2) TaxID=1122177 RepID=A0A2D0N0Q5_FLAN2|nr:M57 family metalloprotease [Flavilitoribacter nigricans]PHN01946.1 protease B [Flavilitoribacter nigricans DSM 23189 = NBRC 102662]
MQKLLKLAIPVLGLALLTYSCQKDRSTDLAVDVVPQEVIDQLTHMGFNPDGIERVEEGYRIERDIIITDEFLNSKVDRHFVPNLEQYSTNNLVTTNGNRVITMYAPEGGRNGYSAGMIAGLDLAIERYNDENLGISFQRISNSNQADIVMTRLKKGDERRGVLGSAGFPTASGDPYDEIKMSGILESSYGLSTEGIATIIAHEMGHCIGFRHTDYFDRSISCGGGTANEGASTVGANHIPGTPTGATASAKSFMLACTDGGDRPFNNDDKTALNYLY